MWRAGVTHAFLIITSRDASSAFGNRKGTTKKLSDKDFAERSGELSGAICPKTLVLLGIMSSNPSDCSENSLVLFV